MEQNIKHDGQPTWLELRRPEIVGAPKGGVGPLCLRDGLGIEGQL